jgi:hypothetical protein
MDQKMEKKKKLNVGRPYILGQKIWPILPDIGQLLAKK